MDDSKPISKQDENEVFGGKVVDTFVLARSDSNESKAMSKEEYEKLQQKRRLLSNGTNRG